MHRKALLALALAIASPAALAEIPKQLQVCKADDNRVRVTEWTPRFNGAALLTKPAAEDGDVVYMEFLLDSADAGCAGAKPDHLYSFGHSYGEDEGGISMNLRGNVQFANGMCYFAGFFMNETVMGLHQGWTETYFRPLDKAEVLTSGRYCASTKNSSDVQSGARTDAMSEVAAGFTSKTLRDLCEGISDGGKLPPQHLACLAYVRGFTEGSELQAKLSKSVTPSCSGRATTPEVARAYVRWYDEPDAERPVFAATALATAMLAAYPCL